MLVEKFHANNCKDKEILVDIEKAIGGSPSLRSKKELIMNFVSSVNTGNVTDEWRAYVTERKNAELETIIKDEKLKPEETAKFIENAFRDGVLKTTGTDIDKIMPPVPLFGGGSGANRAEKKKGILEKLKGFFERFFGLV